MFFLITGGLGYLGGRLAEHLTQKGHRVRLTTRRPRETWPIWARNLDVQQVDVFDKTSWKNALHSIDFVFHLASPDVDMAAQDPISALRAGGEIAWGLLDVLAGGDKKIPIVNISTFHVYGPRVQGLMDETLSPRPVHPYAISHLFSEIVVNSFCDAGKVNGLNVRLSNTFGRPVSSDSAKWPLVFNDLCRQAVETNQLVLKSSGSQKRNFVTLEDTVRALLFLAGNQDGWPQDRIIHLGSSIQMSVREVAEFVARRSKEVLQKELVLVCRGSASETLISDFVFDVTRLKRAGFSWKNRIENEVDGTLTACREWL